MLRAPRAGRSARAACRPAPRHRHSGALSAAPKDLRASIAKLLRGAKAEPPSDRHLEVLRTALALFAERGYAGGSLRELARRLGVQQPSLYHWFDSKEQLVEQIILHLGAELLSAYPSGDVPAKLADVPRFIVRGVLAVWEQPAYVEFLRFLFAVSMVKPRYRAAMHALYAHGTEAATTALMQPFVERGDLDEADARALVRITVNALGLTLIEERLLFGKARTSPEILAYAERVERLLAPLFAR